MRFFLLDRITRWDVGASAEALKNVSLSEDFFDDHFPRHPLMPGVLILEGLAQLSGLLLEESLRARTGRGAKAVLTILERTKFRHMVHPGDTLTYRAEIASLQDAGGKARATALLGDRIVTATELVFVFKDVQDPKLEEKRQTLLALWRRGAADGEETDAGAFPTGAEGNSGLGPPVAGEA